LIVCGDLVRAIRREAAIAVASHWGVSKGTIKLWRQALGVPEKNEGTFALKREIALSRTDDRIERARANSKLPKALRKLSKSLKGRVQSAATIEGVRRAAKRPRSEAWKQKLSAYWRRRGHPPGHPERRFWTKREDALLGTDSDTAIARKIRRSLWAVYLRRRKLGIAPFRRQREPRRRRKSAARS
jgi:hypothetical protein